jgi:metal-sulfur cluster biosynthetic enzyme
MLQAVAQVAETVVLWEVQELELQVKVIMVELGLIRVVQTKAVAQVVAQVELVPTEHQAQELSVELDFLVQSQALR